MEQSAFRKWEQAITMESGVKAKAWTNHKDRLAEEDHGEAKRENKYKGIND